MDIQEIVAKGEPFTEAREPAQWLTADSFGKTVHRAGNIRRTVELGLHGEHARSNSARNIGLDQGPQRQADMLDRWNGW